MKAGEVCSRCDGKGFLRPDGTAINSFHGLDHEDVNECPECIDKPLAPPNSGALRLASRVLREMESIGLDPDFVGQSECRGGGVLISFSEGKKHAFAEIDNEGEVTFGTVIYDQQPLQMWMPGKRPYRLPALRRGVLLLDKHMRQQEGGCSA